MAHATMLEALGATGPEPAHAEALALYGRLVGEWAITNRFREGDGTWREAEGRWSFGWILGGRAIQDVIACPGLTDHYPGTTLRWYEPAEARWQIRWIDPYSGMSVAQIGRADGDGIVQDGTGEDGSAMRWTFTEITDHSFRWRGYRSVDGGDFELDQEMRAHR